MPTLKKNIVTRRPAEISAPVAMTLAMLIGSLIGVDDKATLAELAIVVSFVPAAVTWLVTLIRG